MCCSILPLWGHKHSPRHVGHHIDCVCRLLWARHFSSGWQMKAIISSFVIFLVASLSLLIASDIYQNCKTESNRNMQIWSRGLARTCCTVFPLTFAKHFRGYFEAGSLADSNYIFKRPVISGDVVYVAIADFPSFVSIFLQLPLDARIVLVLGCEDIGAPWEIFHPNRTKHHEYSMNYLWPNGQPLTMRQFLQDPRLQKLFVQNYDLVGCNHFSCSDVKPGVDDALINKVVPIPIGLDFHTIGEKVKKGAKLKSMSEMLESVCEQRQDHDRIAVTSAPDRCPYLSRRLAIHAEFDCSFEAPKGRDMRVLTRGELCSLIKAQNKRHLSSLMQTRGRESDRLPLGQGIAHRDQVSWLADNDTVHFIHHHSMGHKPNSREAKLAFWERVSGFAFSLSPPGFGADTHRVWEILTMHAVPIVLTSPLDRLYLQFPIVIVPRWGAILEAGALRTFRRDIVTRFGPEPFLNGSVIDKLSMEYWIELINAAALPL